MKTIVTLFFIITTVFATNVFAAQSDTSNTLELLTQKIQAQSGKVVYVDFWASWCIPCRKSFPWMNQLQQKYQNKGLVILSVNLDHDRKLADEFLVQHPAKFPVIYDPKGLIARKYKLKGMPSSFIINRVGNIVSSHVGFNKKKSMAYEQEIIKLLNQPVNIQVP